MRVTWIIMAMSFPVATLAQTNLPPITPAQARDAANLFALNFSASEMEMLRPGLEAQRRKYERLRQFPLSNGIPPALQFNPLPVGFRLPTARKKFRPAPLPQIRRPDNPEALAFCSISELAALIKSRQLTATELTRVYLERLKRIGPQLECVVTLTEDRALKQAQRADREIAAGKWRGPLHGIPYGAKDLFATRGIPTTWGAAPFINQVFDFDATVIQRLEAAGAVLIAKTTLGELAMGETWFGGVTRNPWNLKQGSGGSSAGSAAGTAAGLFAFGLGTETYGSILSPAGRCGVTGLRPTYGRVSRAGAMTLSWSMDKIGPICRTVEDCALVLHALYGPDGLDQTVVDAPFNYRARLDVTRLRVGFLQSLFATKQGEARQNDDATLADLRRLGVKLQPVELPDYPLSQISFLLSTEAAAAFDELTLRGQDAGLRQQTADAWPNTFRERRFVPAVEYLRAQRIRWLLIQDMAKTFAPFDVIIAPADAGMTVLLGNLTGHPCVALPNGFTSAGMPTSICFLGRLFGEAELLSLAKTYQDATSHHRRHPAL
ncbi:MAG TPA: amidase [Verrucomicrobiota bacterium]|nr:amidase [Verrucomicrobiota bacterium]HNT14948.1 amidase [Verrucomicrobiota bacterium]